MSTTAHERPVTRALARGRWRTPAAAALVAVLVVASRAAACIWDSDTLEAERKGLPDILEILVGRFDRNPPLWFEMRLARATAAVAANADDFAAYDDAGVACDRLGRGEEAIRWMDRKAERLRAMGDAAPAEHVYRRLANQGTLRAHHWLRTGADRARLAEMRQARDEIAEAIRIHPDAHFGRERYQLRAMDWIADPPVASGGDTYGLAPDFLGLPGNRIGSVRTDNGALAELGMPDAVEGLSGLVVLGAAWESVDVFHALDNALAIDGRSSVAYVASLRCAELIRAGRTSLLPGAPTGEALVTSLHAGTSRFLYPREVAALDAWYAEARAAADRWARAREDFVLARLRAGRHPDTDSSFWDDWDDDAIPMPTPPGGTLADRTLDAMGLLHPQQAMVAGPCWLVSLAVVGVTVVLVVRSRRRKARAAANGGAGGADGAAAAPADPRQR